MKVTGWLMLLAAVAGCESERSVPARDAGTDATPVKVVDPVDPAAPAGDGGATDAAVDAAVDGGAA